MQKRGLHSKLHCMPSSRTGTAVQLVTKTLCALASSVGSERLETPYSPYNMYEEGTGLLQVAVARGDSFSSLSRRISLDGLAQSFKEKEEVDKVACERSVVVDRAVVFLNPQVFTHLRTPLGYNSFQTLDDNQLLK